MMIEPEQQRDEGAEEELLSLGQIFTEQQTWLNSPGTAGWFLHRL